MRYGLPVAIGKFVSSISSLVVLALLARHLGPTLFGVLAVMRTVVTVVDSFANFNTWQALIKYGTEAIAARRPDDVDRVIKLAFAIDAISAVLGTLVVAGLAFVIPATFGWDDSEARLCALYGITILSHIAGGPDGIFRIFDAYRAQAIATSILSLLVTGSVAIAVALDASFGGCVLAVVIGEVLGNILILVVALWVARQRGHGGWLRSSLAGWRTRFPGIGHFLLSTNAQLTVKKVSADTDMFVVGAMLGSFPSGLYRVVKQLGALPLRIFMPFEQVIFTELARYVADHDYVAFRRLLRRTVGIMMLGSLGIWAAASTVAEPMIALVAGDEYIGAAWTLRWYFLAMAFTITSAPTMRGIIALGRPGTLFLFDLATVALLIATSIVCVHLWGLPGAAIALLGHRTFQFVWSWWLVMRIAKTSAGRQN